MSDMSSNTPKEILRRLWTYRKQMQELSRLSRELSKKLDSDAVGEINCSLDKLDYQLHKHSLVIAVEMGHIIFEMEEECRK